MDKLIHYDNVTGAIIGFYDDTLYHWSVQFPVPTPTLVVTDIEWQDCIDNQTHRTINVSTLAIEVMSLADEKTTAKGKIDTAAGQARARYITDVPGQELTYQEKTEEATDYVAASYPVDTSGYPFIVAEVNATGKTATAAADDILSTRSAWLTIGASIEQERIGGKVAVDAGVDIAGVDTAKDAAIIALDAI